MSRTSLRVQLWRMGRAAARKGAGGRTRALALLLAGALLALVLAAVVAVYASYDGIHARSAHRALVPQAAAPSSRPVAVAFEAGDDVNGLQHTMIYIRPLTPESPLPPGVHRWPAPGEAVLSPGLIRALKSEHSPERFGRVVSTVAPEGLASPGERIGYANPRDIQFNAKAMRPVVGFGGPGAAPSGDLMFIKDRGRVIQALYLMLLPAGVLAVVAARMGSVGRDKRTALVSALGGGRRARVWLNLGESATPVLSGVLLGSLPGALIAATGDTRLPWIDFWLSSADLRHWWPQLMGATLAAALLLLLLVCVMDRTGGRRRPRTTRMMTRAFTGVRWAGMAFPFLLLATVAGPSRLDPARYQDLRAQLYNLGVVAVLMTLPCAVALGAAAMGGALARSTRRTGSPGAVIAGRHIAAHPGATARLVAGIGIALVVVSQVQLVTLQFGGAAKAARETAHRVGKSVMVLHTTENLPPQQLTNVWGRLPANTELLSATEPKEPSDVVLIQGSCTALQAVRLPCTSTVTQHVAAAADRRLVEALRWSAPLTFDRFASKEQTGSADQGASTATHWVLVSADGGDLPELDIKQLLRDSVPTLSATAEVPGDLWMVGTNLSVAHGRWVTYFGAGGILVLGIAVALTNLAEFLRFSRALAPLSVLTGSRRLYYSTAAWALLAPLLGAIAVSVVAAIWLASPQERPELGIEVSMPMLGATALALAGLSITTWYGGSRAAVKQSTQWRPYGE
ncbi:hypothetical protein ABZ726_05935 [Streptomyces hundungensis]|uniref:hypothetical protein n=1 Tax=Streptomyces hundungensis TaxID=1077946 RepID=UPI0034063E2A